MSRKRTVVQSLLAAGLVLAGLAADQSLRRRLGFGLLDFGTTTAFVAGLSFGWAALPGAALGWLVYGILFSAGSFSPGVLGAGLLLAASGALLLRVPTWLGWKLASFETYLTAIAFTAVAAVAAARMLAGARGVSTMGELLSLSGQITASFILMAAVLVRSVNRLARPWIEPIWLPESPGSKMELVSWGRRLLMIALTVAVAVAVRQTIDQPPILHEWTRLLFVVPIVLLGRYGISEGHLAGSIAGVAALIAVLPESTNVTGGAGAYLPHQAAATILPFLGVVVGWAFEREWLLRTQLRQALSNTVGALRGSLAVRHAHTEDHTVRVARYAVATGRRMGLGDAELEDLETAGLLHDIGKIGVPDAVLRKPGSLRWHEAEAMRKHPEIGARLLEQVSGLEAAVPLVLHHQERYDGRTVGPYPGYPDGLAGEAIPLGSRIIAVVDAFDAMTSDREYRKACTVEQAIAELRAESGKQFDPAVVEAFLEVLNSRPWRRADAAPEEEEEAAVLEFLASRSRERAQERAKREAEPEPQAR